MLAKSKSNSIESLISQALIDLKVSHEELLTKKTSMKKIKERTKIMKNSD